MSKELKPLVFSLNDLAYVDESAVKKNFENPHDHAVYKATEVDAFVKEKDAEIEKLKTEIKNLSENWNCFVKKYNKIIALKQKFFEEFKQIELEK